MSGMNVLVALKLATVWGTPVVCGADDGYLVDELGGWPSIAQRIDKATGQAMAKRIQQGYETLERTLKGALRYDQLVLPMALLRGTAGTPDSLPEGAYQHDLVTADDTYGLFMTAAGKDGQRVQEAQSAKVTRVEIVSGSDVDDGVVQCTFNLLCDHMNLNAAGVGTNNPTTFASVTVTEEGQRAMHEELVIRINDQDGAALDSDDEIEMTQVRLVAERPHQGDHTNINRYIREPKQTGMMTDKVTLVYPWWDSTILALVDDWLAGTAKKADLTWTGELIGSTEHYTFQAQYPSLMPTNMQALKMAYDQRITPITIELDGLEVDSAPTGMTGITRPLFTAINTQSADPLA